MGEKTQDTFILRIDFYPQIKMLDRLAELCKQ